MSLGHWMRHPSPAFPGLGYAGHAMAHATLPPGVTLRPMLPSDIPDGLRLCRAAGWNQRAEDWAQFLALAPDGARVALLDGRVAGTVATIRYGMRFAWVGMVLVDPAARGRGIGTCLLEAGLSLLADMPCVRLDATAAGYPLYLKRGFVEEYRILRMEAIVPGGLAAATGSARPMTRADLADVAAYDAGVFGARRDAMLRWMLEGAPEYAWVAETGGRTTGYAFGRHGHDFEHLGPIGAEDVDTAFALAAAALGPRAGRRFVIDAPMDHTAWVRRLEAIAFAVQRPLIRMALGSGCPGADRPRQLAILGPEFG